jgi:hypothetical protein
MEVDFKRILLSSQLIAFDTYKNIEIPPIYLTYLQSRDPFLPIPILRSPHPHQFRLSYPKHTPHVSSFANKNTHLSNCVFQELASTFWFACDYFTDMVFVADLVVQLRTGYLEQGLMVYDARKLAGHYLNSRAFILDLLSLTPLDLLYWNLGTHPMLRFPRFLKVYRAIDCYYIVESRTVYPNFWRVINLIHILLILAHWFGCFYFLLSQAEGFQVITRDPF